MAMRIKGTDSSPVESGGTRPVERIRRSTPVDSGTTPARSGTDSVHITDSARQLAGLEQAIREALDRGVPHPNAVRLALERRREARGEPPPVAPALPARAQERDAPVRPHALDTYDKLKDTADD